MYTGNGNGRALAQHSPTCLAYTRLGIPCLLTRPVNYGSALLRHLPACLAFSPGAGAPGDIFLRWWPLTWEQSELASQPRVLPVRALSTGDWIPSAQLVVMTAMRGAHFKTAGHHHHAYQTTVLRPEEALFLVEKGVLEVTVPCFADRPATALRLSPVYAEQLCAGPRLGVQTFHGHERTSPHLVLSPIFQITVGQVFEQGLPMTVQRAFHALRPAGMTPSELTVYIMLRRMGYARAIPPLIHPVSRATCTPPPHTPSLSPMRVPRCFPHPCTTRGCGRRGPAPRRAGSDMYCTGTACRDGAVATMVVAARLVVQEKGRVTQRAAPRRRLHWQQRSRTASRSRG